MRIVYWMLHGFVRAGMLNRNISRARAGQETQALGTCSVDVSSLVKGGVCVSVRVLVACMVVGGVCARVRVLGACIRVRHDVACMLCMPCVYAARRSRAASLRLVLCAF